MERRKDSKGRVLKEGESERSDGRYQYRWTDRLGKRHTVYGATLNELREKENEVQKLQNNGLASSCSTTVYDLTDKYVNIHRASVRPDTYDQLVRLKKKVENTEFGRYKISDVTTTMAKMWLTSLYNDGASYSLINNLKAVLRPAFDMALDDNLILRNPFDFSLSKIIQNTSVEKRPVTNDEYVRLITFARSNPRFYKFVDEIIVLYETGLRVGEFCGLTFCDIDLEKNTIKVERQVQKATGRPRYIQKPKTKKGVRIIPLSPAAKESILNITMNRPKVKREAVIDGVTDFLTITAKGNPKLGLNISYTLRNLIALYNKEHPDNPLPRITPHSLRHTFCTRMILSGMNIKTVQYLMGHSTVSVTLNVYSHIMSTADVVKEFEERLPLLGCTPTNRALMSAASREVLTPERLGDTNFDTAFQKVI